MTVIRAASWLRIIPPFRHSHSFVSCHSRAIAPRFRLNGTLPGRRPGPDARRTPHGRTGPRKPVELLIITGDTHPAHDWKTTTPALRDVLSAQGRVEVHVT